MARAHPVPGTLIALAAGLLLAACSVEVEGARCERPFAAGQCPEGQACGNDHVCTARAAACAAPGAHCCPEGTDGCTASPLRCSADGLAVLECRDLDPCGAWTVRASCSGGLTCGTVLGAELACVCSDPTAELAADPGAPPVPAGLVRTGAAEPTYCRFQSLAAALDHARGPWRDAHPGSAVVVQLMRSDGGTSPVEFGGEPHPLVVAAGVTLRGETADPGAFVVVADPGDASDVLELHGGGAVEGLTLRSASATGDGLQIVCDGEMPARAAALRVEGAAVLACGARVTGACALEATRVELTGAVGPGLFVEASSVDKGATFIGGSLEGNGGAGAEVRAGRLVLAGDGSLPLRVHGNGRHGVHAAPREGSPQPISLEVTNADVYDNGEVGIRIEDLGLAAGSSAAVRGSLVRKNRGSTELSLYGTGRTAGGVLLYGGLPFDGAEPAAPAFTFQGNTVCSNAGDEVGVFSDDPWPLSGASCGPTSNAFLNAGAASYLIYFTTGLDRVVPAWNNKWWPTDPPSGLTVKANVVPSCGLAAPVAECG